MFWKKKKKALEISNLAFQGSFIVHRREAQRDKCVQLLHKRRNFPLQEAQVSTLFKNPKAFSEAVKVYLVQAVLMMQDEFMRVNNAVTENPAWFFCVSLACEGALRISYFGAFIYEGTWFQNQVSINMFRWKWWN